MVLNTELQKW